MRGVRRNPGSLSSTTTWESTRGSGASQREHDEHKDGAMVPPQRNERPTDDGGKAGRWFVALTHAAEANLRIQQASTMSKHDNECVFGTKI